MADLTSQVIENTRKLNELYGRKAASIVTINGQEFYSRNKGEHNFWLTLGNDMEFVSMMKFKLIFGNGRSAGGGGGDSGLHGNGLYKTPMDWFDRYPPGTGVDVDGVNGFQCWDYADAFWLGQVNRTLVTRPGGNGNACDCWNISLNTNRVGFTVINNWSDLKQGDWAFWDCGGDFRYGHVACVFSGPNSDGTYNFYGQNQGGTPNITGGAAVSTAKLSATNFLGALRYNGWA